VDGQKRVIAVATPISDSCCGHLDQSRRRGGNGGASNLAIALVIQS
jgi:hypothetical protein